MLMLLHCLLRLAPAPHTARSNEAHTFLTISTAPMQELHPPQASNDDPLRILHETVERDLQRAGLIR